jgi:hypothetical protein
MWFSPLPVLLGSFVDDGGPYAHGGPSKVQETRLRTRHETIGALDWFAQHKPRAN